MSVMTDELELANQIAQKIVKLKELRKQKLSTQRQIEDLTADLNAKKEEINSIEQSMRTIKYEICDSLTDDVVKLKVVGD